MTLIGVWGIPNALPKPDYVPTIANGLVASMSILIAFAIFEMTLTNTNIQDKVVKAKFRLRATYYLVALFAVLYFGVFFGYRLILYDDLAHAFSWFMSAFTIMFGIISDLPHESDVT